MDIELLPCPCCGGKAQSASTVEYGTICKYVECKNSECGMNNLQGMFYDMKDAIKAWNTRHVPNDVVEYGGYGLKPNASFTLVGGEWVADNV